MNYVYMVQCSDGTYYTGWTTDVKKRVQMHNSGKNGAKYTKARRPVRLVYMESLADKSAALKREAEIKKLTRKEKMAMASQWNEEK